MFANLNLQVQYIQHQSSECLIYTFFLKVCTVIMVIRQYDVGRDGENSIWEQRLLWLSST